MGDDQWQQSFVFIKEYAGYHTFYGNGYYAIATLTPMSESYDA